jgi:L-methionine (R)-S-oxide reductase
MEKPKFYAGPNFYSRLVTELGALLNEVWITNLANTAALLTQHLQDINWVGFYLVERERLVLGPFQGKPACLYIPMGRGVCGTSAQQRRSLVVPDVERFADHIACDSASRSEIVIPLLAGNRLIGVLDLDSPLLDRFDEEDRAGLERLARVLVEKTAWPEPLIVVKKTNCE